MNEVVFPLLFDEIDVAIVELIRVRNQIDSFIKTIKRNSVDLERLRCLKYNIRAALSWWVGHTYVGVEKDKHLKNAFQCFFVSFYSFLRVCQSSDIVILHDFAERVLYQGVVYRYLGYRYDSNLDKTTPKIVDYNNIFVSWSKNAVNSYIESKLYGMITRLTCDISGDNYGIDLTACGVFEGFESEVVFPTIKECINKVEYAESFI